VRGGHLKIVERLFPLCPLTDEKAHELLVFACSHGYTQIVEFFLKNGADVKKQYAVCIP